MNNITSPIILAVTMAIVCVVGEIVIEPVRGRLFTFESPADDLTIEQARDAIAKFLLEHKYKTNLVGSEVAKVLVKLENKHEKTPVLGDYSVYDFITLNYWWDAIDCSDEEFKKREKMCKRMGKWEDTPVVGAGSKSTDFKEYVYFHHSVSSYCWDIYREMRIQCGMINLDPKMSITLDQEYAKKMEEYFGKGAKNNELDSKAEEELRIICKQVLEKLPKPPRLDCRDWDLLGDLGVPERLKWARYYVKCQNLTSSSKFNQLESDLFP